jgi:hypothetical protein
MLRKVVAEPRSQFLKETLVSYFNCVGMDSTVHPGATNCLTNPIFESCSGSEKHSEGARPSFRT